MHWIRVVMPALHSQAYQNVLQLLSCMVLAAQDT